MTYISESPRPIVSLHAKNGFTMIELLLVIVIVGSLATSALPAMLDFRNLGRKAAAQALLNALRSGMKNQVNNIRLRCDAPVGAVLTKAALQQNTVLLSMGSSWAVNGGTPAGTCNSTQVRNSVDGRILDTGSTMPNDLDPYHS